MLSEGSQGSIGHPEQCGPPCKYSRRRNGCRDGAECPSCTYCFMTFSIEISKGSVNHPTGCAMPCKFLKKKGGCMQGRNCKMCHLCFWSRERKSVADRVVEGGGANMSADWRSGDGSGASENDIHTPRSACACETCMSVRCAQSETYQGVLETRTVKGVQ